MIHRSYWDADGLSSLIWYHETDEIGIEFWTHKGDGEMMIDFVNHAVFIVARRFCGVNWVFV